MQWQKAPKITVIGGAYPSAEIYQLAYQVGRLLGQAGAVLICGGLGGVMAAACKGARETGGLTIGILPGADPSTANEDVDIAIVTESGEARNIAVVASGQAVIAVDGQLGTLTEIAFALKRQLPVIGLHTWQLDPAKSAGRQVVTARTPEEAVSLALQLRRRQGCFS